MKAKRYIWIWVAVDASDQERLLWQNFVRVNMTISNEVRFLVVNSEKEFTIKTSILERAGWEMGRWGDGWMERVIFYVKDESNDETPL